MPDELTASMREALLHVGFGVRKYHDGYRNIETTEKVDGRSLQALRGRGLVEWSSVGGCQPQIYLHLTPEGEELFEELLRHEVKRRFGNRWRSSR